MMKKFGKPTVWLDVYFLKHFWLVTVPNQGVTNRFDYPLGLVYLLFVGPFFYMCINSFRKREFPIIPTFIILYWLSWWLGSQQSRFSDIPMILTRELQ